MQAFRFNFVFIFIFAILSAMLSIFTQAEQYSGPSTVTLIANWNDEACGVAESCRHFANSLEKKGIKVIKLNSFEVFADENTLKEAILKVKKSHSEVVNIHYHRGLYGNKHPQINIFMRKLKRLYKIPTVISLHNEREGVEEDLSEAQLFIYYFKSKLVDLDNQTKSIYIPLPAPQFKSSLTRTQLRKKYGYSDDDIIISSAGFAFEFKRFPEIISLLAPFVKGDKNIKLQLLVSKHQTYPFSFNELTKIRETVVFNGLEDQAYISGIFLETQEYLERLSISNVEFSWCPEDAYESSAIEKDFVAVRVPLIVNNVEHNQLKTGEGVIRVNGELGEFVSEIVVLLLNNDSVKNLKSEMKKSYSLLNYGHAASLHLKYFRKLIEFNSKPRVK